MLKLTTWEGSNVTTPEKWTFKKMGSTTHPSSEETVSANTVTGDIEGRRSVDGG